MSYNLSENEYYLEPEYDSRKSFYKKAIVEKNGDVSKLYSYGTLVATIDSSKKYDERCTIHGFYSQTTTRHIKDFIWQNGYTVGSVEELRKLYTESGRKEAEQKRLQLEERTKKRIEKERLKAEREEKKQERLEIKKDKLRNSIKKEFGNLLTDKEIELLVINEL